MVTHADATFHVGPELQSCLRRVVVTRQLTDTLHQWKTADNPVTTAVQQAVAVEGSRWTNTGC